MNKYKIVLEYDGSNYVGWQKQENGKSIQESIEIAIQKLIGEKTIVHGAGRTDSGVHAKAQVAHFEINKIFETDKIRDGLNQYLRSETIAVLKAEKVNEDFHARFSAKLRYYQYRVINRRPHLTLENNRAWCVHKKLDIKKILKESTYFKGKHDFESFRSIDCQSAKSVKTVNFFLVNHQDDNVTFNVCAKSFLHSQVRIMVGTLIDIGKGIIKKPLLEIIESKKRSFAGTTAPAHGLYLKKIDY